MADSLAEHARRRRRQRLREEVTSYIAHVIVPTLVAMTIGILVLGGI